MSFVLSSRSTSFRGTGISRRSHFDLSLLLVWHIESSRQKQQHSVLSPNPQAPNHSHIISMINFVFFSKQVIVTMLWKSVYDGTAWWRKAIKCQKAIECLLINHSPSLHAPPSLYVSFKSIIFHQSSPAWTLFHSVCRSVFVCLLGFCRQAFTHWAANSFFIIFHSVQIFLHAISLHCMGNNAASEWKIMSDGNKTSLRLQHKLKHYA